MPPKLLTVNHTPQEEQSGCLAACAQMILAYWNVASQQRQLNRLFNRTDIGARFTQLVRLKQYGLQVTLQSGDEYKLIDAIDKGVLPIIFVATGELRPVQENKSLVGASPCGRPQGDAPTKDGDFNYWNSLTSYWQEHVQHAVVIVGYDESNFYLNDPAFADTPKQVAINELMLAWLELDYIYALVTR